MSLNNYWAYAKTCVEIDFPMRIIMFRSLRIALRNHMKDLGYTLNPYKPIRIMKMARIGPWDTWFMSGFSKEEYDPNRMGSVQAA